MHSRWGVEEKETLQAIVNIGYQGTILNLASGDGRFNNSLLQFADVVTCDINQQELDTLQNETPQPLKQKLKTIVADIQKLPFEDNSFDGIFCTGTLHLFNNKILHEICNEICRVVKHDGKLIIDFACDIKRINKENREPLRFNGEIGYTETDAKRIIAKFLKDFKLKFETYNFCEENSETPNGEKYELEGKFLLVTGVKKYKF